MKVENYRRVTDYVSGLMQRGRYAFTSNEAGAALGGTKDAVKLALNRLRRKGDIASPMRGFYVIVPSDYRALGCLPADQFIPDLLQRSAISYYVGLLSAAQYHGAAHHRPQVFQVMVEKPRRAIVCGKVRVCFHVRKHLCDVPVQQMNTLRGTIAISTPAATAFDLIGYEAQIGGLGAVATLLADLAEKLDADDLGQLAPRVPLPWSQRLGYLLDQIGEAPRALALKNFVQEQAREAVPLAPSICADNMPRDRAWKLIINTGFEVEA